MGIIDVNVTEGFAENQGTRIVSPCSNFTVTIGGPGDLVASIDGLGDSVTFTTDTTTQFTYEVYASGHPALIISNVVTVSPGLIDLRLILSPEMIIACI